MPLLKIQTNRPVDTGKQSALLAKASQLVAEKLGKPEQYVMVALESNNGMLFAGSDAPLAYLELKSIGLPESRTTELSQALCGLMEQELGVSQDRVYVEFNNAPRNMWGWNGGTF